MFTGGTIGVFTPWPCDLGSPFSPNASGSTLPVMRGVRLLEVATPGCGIRCVIAAVPRVPFCSLPLPTSSSSSCGRALGRGADLPATAGLQQPAHGALHQGVDTPRFKHGKIAPFGDGGFVPELDGRSSSARTAARRSGRVRGRVGGHKATEKKRGFSSMDEKVGIYDLRLVKTSWTS